MALAISSNVTPAFLKSSSEKFARKSAMAFWYVCRVADPVFLSSVSANDSAAARAFSCACVYPAHASDAPAIPMASGPPAPIIVATPPSDPTSWLADWRTAPRLRDFVARDRMLVPAERARRSSSPSAAELFRSDADNTCPNEAFDSADVAAFSMPADMFLPTAAPAF